MITLQLTRSSGGMWTAEAQGLCGLWLCTTESFEQPRDAVLAWISQYTESQSFSVSIVGDEAYVSVTQPVEVVTDEFGLTRHETDSLMDWCMLQNYGSREYASEQFEQMRGHFWDIGPMAARQELVKFPSWEELYEEVFMG